MADVMDTTPLRGYDIPNDPGNMLQIRKMISGVDSDVDTISGMFFNAQEYGWLPDGTDRSIQALFLLSVVSAAGGGTIYFPPSTGQYRADSQLFIPNDSASPQPHQVNIRFTGAGGGANWNAFYNLQLASTLDLRYHAVDGNAKIESRGLGTIEIDHLMIIDGGSVDNTPFVHITNTTPHIHDCTFKGSTVYTQPMPGGWTRSTQDAIVLGGATNTVDGSVTATYQGYIARIRNNHFTQLNRWVYVRWNANGAIITGNSGQGNTGTCAIESDGVVGDPNLLTSGLMVVGNTFEMDLYLYGVVLTNTIGSRFENSFYDSGPGYLASYYLTTSPGNTIIRTATPGYGSDVIDGDAASITSTNCIGGIAAPAVGSPGGQLDVHGLGNTNAEFGNNLVVRGNFNYAYIDTYPGQLALLSASEPNRGLRLGYNYTTAGPGTGDYAFIDARRHGIRAEPLLLNPFVGTVLSVPSDGFVGIGDITVAALARPLHVAEDGTGGVARFGVTNYIDMIVGGAGAQINGSSGVPLKIKSNGAGLGIRLDINGDIVLNQDGQTSLNRFVVNSSGNGFRVGDTTDTNYLDFISGGALSRFSASGNRPLIFRSNSIDALTIDGAGNVAVNDQLTVADEAYGVGWNASLEVPTKNAVYDKIETVIAGASLPSLAGNSLKYLRVNVGETAAEWATVSGSGASTALDNLASVAINAALVLGTSDAFALGSPTKMWSDVYVALGAVIDFNNGDVTITHSSNNIAVAGGTLSVPDDAYDATTWNGNFDVPTKNAIRDKIETISGGGIGGSTGASDNRLIQANGTGGATIKGANAWSIDGSDRLNAGGFYLDPSGPRLYNPNGGGDLYLGSSGLTNVVRIDGGTVFLVGAVTDATKTDNTLCVDTTTNQVYKGSGTIGICLGTSSVRFKQGWKELTLGLRELLALNPGRFRYIEGYGDDGNKEQFGFIAEDAADVIPELVGLDSEGLPNSFDLVGLIPLLVNAIKDQQAQIQTLNLRLVTVLYER